MHMHEHIPLPATLQSPLAVVCHDAGAAHLIFAWLRRWCEAGLLDQHIVNMVLQGPAAKTWQHHPIPLPNVHVHSALNSVLEGSQCLLTGTGWASHLEHQARQIAGSLGIPSVAVIDHWVNYTQRLEREGIVVLPDQIWVADEHAERIANEIFPATPVLCLPNLYLQNLVKGMPPVSPECRNLLYVLEPVRDEWGSRFVH